MATKSKNKKQSIGNVKSSINKNYGVNVWSKLYYQI